MVMAWGLLGVGQHRARIFVNGRGGEDFTFTVVGFNDPFLTGKNKELREINRRMFLWRNKVRDRWRVTRCQIMPLLALSKGVQFPGVLVCPG